MYYTIYTENAVHKIIKNKVRSVRREEKKRNPNVLYIPLNLVNTLRLSKRFLLIRI